MNSTAIKAILTRINYGFDGLIRRFNLSNFNQALVEVSCFDKVPQQWINIEFVFENVKEVKLFQALNTTSQILSDGIAFGLIDEYYYLDFNAYLDLDATTTLADIRKSDVYVISEKISFTLKPYQAY